MKNYKSNLTKCLIFMVLPLIWGFKNDWKTYKNESKGVEINHPSDWLVSEGSNPVFIIKSPSESQNDKFQENINLVILDANGATLSAFVERTQAEVRQLFGNLAIETIYPSTINGHAGYELVYGGMYGPLQLKWRQFIHVRQNKAFVLTFTTTQRQYETLKSTADHIFYSFKIR